MSTPDTPTTEQVVELEARRYAAMVDADLDTLDELLGDEVIYTHSNAAVDDKATYLETMRSGTLVYLALEHRVDTVFSRPGLAIACGTMSGAVRLHGSEKTLDNRVVAVWVADGRRWRLAAFQSTPVPA
ncbi:nuclear transport factor 2 family protein [Pseudonocardia nigra]|uniref:nuclear transport factor 2 family protein n=1 Tax=Pseudonocardia nigra TaxID=1921578 RepID=UPI001C5CDF77|nr:nuclear transport factor 2 family protein [Pseudonocardia nigra]